YGTGYGPSGWDICMQEEQSTPPAGLFPLKPIWIYDLLTLWRRNQPLALLLEQATDYVAQELRSQAVRRVCLAAIATLFVETRRRGKQPYTLSQNVWATYSRNLPLGGLVSAYLVHLVAQWPLAYALAAQL